MDPKNQPQFNPKIPISEVLKQEQTGFVPSAPKLQDVASVISNMYDSTRDAGGVNMKTKLSGQVGATIVNPPPVSQVKIIKTYRSDAAEAVKTQQASVAKIAIAEDERRRDRGEETEASPKKKRNLLLMAIILIALGVVAIPTVQYILNQKKQGVTIVTEKTIIPFDVQKNVILASVTRDEIISELDILNAKPPTVSKIEYRKILEKTEDPKDTTKTINQKVPADIFAGIIGPNMSPALARSFDSDYMYGISDSKNPTPFILFKTSSYQQTFANMLRWETSMITDLSPVFNLGIDVLGRPFTDKVVANKDVRAIATQDGTILFLYGFLDNQTLIITTNVQTFQDINNRYVTARFVQ